MEFLYDGLKSVLHIPFIEGLFFINVSFYERKS